jgi:hypothetical protein
MTFAREREGDTKSEREIAKRKGEKRERERERQ